MSRIHPQARTTPRTRAEIKASALPLSELAERYNITVATARKWTKRETTQDLSHRPHKLSTTLTAGQEATVVELRRMLLLPLDDLLVVTREFINPAASGPLSAAPWRGQSARLAGRNSPANPLLRPSRSRTTCRASSMWTSSTCRRCPTRRPGATCSWPSTGPRAGCSCASTHQDEAAATDFLRRVNQAAPMKIQTVLTDNGSQFTDRFTSKSRVPSGDHAFDRRCAELAIEHRLCPPRHPQTNGMVERFNGRISELIGQTRFKSAEELETTFKHLSPIQALKQRQSQRPDLFNKRVYDLTGLDN